MKALSTQGVDYYEPIFYAYEVYFGNRVDHRGILNGLNESIAIWAWCQANTTEEFVIEGHRVVFANDQDALRCYEVFR